MSGVAPPLVSCLWNTALCCTPLCHFLHRKLERNFTDHLARTTLCLPTYLPNIAFTKHRQFVKNKTGILKLGMHEQVKILQVICTAKLEPWFQGAGVTTDSSCASLAAAQRRPDILYFSSLLPWQNSVQHKGQRLTTQKKYFAHELCDRGGQNYWISYYFAGMSLKLTLWIWTTQDKVSAIVELSLPRAAYFDIPQIGVKMIFSNTIINFYHILGEIMQKILGL